MAWTTPKQLGALVRQHRRVGPVTDPVDELLQADLIVVDGLGPLPASSDASDAFARLVQRAHQTCSLAITNSVDPARLDQAMPTLETSDIDQLMHRTHVLRTDAGRDTDQAAA